MSKILNLASGLMKNLTNCRRVVISQQSPATTNSSPVQKPLFDTFLTTSRSYSILRNRMELFVQYPQLSNPHKPVLFNSNGAQAQMNNLVIDNIQGRRGFKIKARVKKRCKDCYFTWYKGLLYNLCRTHGRHKQMLKPKYWCNQRILTEVSQQPRRPW